MDRMTPGSELFRKLTELLQQRIGLNPDSVGRQTLEHAVAHRLKTLRQTDGAEYVARLAHDAREWSEFLEEIIVPESWFFRELTPFQCAREFAREAMNREVRPKSLRFLSMPCSRGEEPYSLAMTLLDVGLLSTQFEIVACDLSERSLEFARKGCYRSIAFRETDAVSTRLTRQNFQQTGDVWELSTRIRSTVKFKQANLAQSETLTGLGKFDFIFCRNVLIYLIDDVRQRTLASFNRMLNPGGILYLGHSECRLGPQSGATVWKDRFPAAFTWSKPTNAVSASPASPRGDTAVASSASPTTKPRTPTAARISSSSSSESIAAAKPRQDTPAIDPSKNFLPIAKELANRGRLEEAEHLCQVMVQSQPPMPDVYCLLGVITQARGDMGQAENHYQKALFLQPDHVESLTHVLLLARLRGDVKQVGNYQRRLDRLGHQGT